VEKVEYISPEQAWENFKAQNFENQQELVETFANDNPLSDSASYEIYVKDVENQSELVDSLEQMEGIRKVNCSDQTAKALTTFNRLVSVVSMFVIAILVAVSLFLISTTISVGISVQKRRWIGIMLFDWSHGLFCSGTFYCGRYCDWADWSNHSAGRTGYHLLSLD